MLREKDLEQKPDELEEIIELSLLYDFYGALLKEQKRSIFEAYILENYGLSEIAKERNMSRQAVYDVVRRCRNELREYEQKLNLVCKFQRMKKQVHEIQRQADSIADREAQEAVTTALSGISSLAEQILEEF